jgi:hypothetical protein
VPPVRIRHPLAFATVGVICALIAAWGPAAHERGHVSWPHGVPADDSGATLWYSPLLLSSHTPDRIAVTIPCVELSDGSPVLVFASTRDPAPGRLAVTARGQLLAITLGDETLAETPWPATDLRCDAALVFDRHAAGGHTWSLTRQADVVAHGDAPTPSVSGFFTELDPGSDAHVRVDLTTAVFSSRPTVRQVVFILLAVVAATLAIAATIGARRRETVIVRPGRHAVDAVVGTMVAGWWLVGPWFYDDGWLMATVRAREAGGSFNNYFDTLATQLPLGFGHHWLLSPFAAFDAPFLWWRLVPLAACLVTWGLLRYTFATVCGRDARGPGLIALASSFLVFVFAWLMTLRPEPVIAMLSAAVLLAVIAYRRSRSRVALTAAFLASAIAVTLHPSGVVASAALVAAVPTLVRDARRGVASLADLVAAALVGATAGVLLLFADTDVGRWREARSIFASDGFHSNGVADELNRYRDLLTNGTVPALASVLFAAVAVVLFLASSMGRLRGRPATGERHYDIAGIALIAGAGLLTLTPSKWIYHFGSAAALASLAIAVESGRLAAAQRSRRDAERLAAVLLVALVLARSLRHQRDAQYFMNIRTPRLDVLGEPLLWLAVASIALVAVAVRKGSMQLRGAAAWSLPVALGVVAAFTILTHAVAPAVDGPRWAMPRRGVADVFGGGCTFSEGVDVSDPLRAIVLPTRGGDPSELPLTDAAAVHHPPPDLPALVIHSTDVNGFAATGTLTTEWYDISGLAPTDDIVVAATGRVGRRGVTLEVEWAVDDVGAHRVVGTTALVDPLERQRFYWEPQWRYFRLDQAGARAAAARHVRLVARDESADELGFVAVSEPMAMPRTKLASYLAGREILVSPPQLPLFACTTAPDIRGGVAEMPDMVIGFEYHRFVEETLELGSGSGPWHLAEDAYPTRRLWAWLTDRDMVRLAVRDEQASLGQVLGVSIRTSTDRTSR